ERQYWESDLTRDWHLREPCAYFCGRVRSASSCLGTGMPVPSRARGDISLRVRLVSVVDTGWLVTLAHLSRRQWDTLRVAQDGASVTRLAPATPRRATCPGRLGTSGCRSISDASTVLNLVHETLPFAPSLLPGQGAGVPYALWFGLGNLYGWGSLQPAER